MREALFVGIDLAWSGRNPSGLALPRQDDEAVYEVSPACLLRTEEEIISAIQQTDAGGTLVIAVDAPLIVPNAAGERPVERGMRRRFATFHAGCHPANRRLLGDPPRGERLYRLLGKNLGVQLVAAPPAGEECRGAFEVYPHAAMVILFRLSRILEYKERPQRDVEYRRQQTATYVRLLSSLRRPALQLPTWVDEVPTTSAALKRFEDRLDALFCAWLAAHAWMVGGEVLGDTTTGSIWLPMRPV